MKYEIFILYSQVPQFHLYMEIVIALTFEDFTYFIFLGLIYSYKVYYWKQPHHLL